MALLGFERLPWSLRWAQQSVEKNCHHGWWLIWARVLWKDPFTELSGKNGWFCLLFVCFCAVVLFCVFGSSLMSFHWIQKRFIRACVCGRHSMYTMFLFCTWIECDWKLVFGVVVVLFVLVFFCVFGCYFCGLPFLALFAFQVSNLSLRITMGAATCSRSYKNVLTIVMVSAAWEQKNASNRNAQRYTNKKSSKCCPWMTTSSIQLKLESSNFFVTKAVKRWNMCSVFGRKCHNTSGRPQTCTCNQTLQKYGSSCCSCCCSCCCFFLLFSLLLLLFFFFFFLLFFFFLFSIGCSYFFCSCFSSSSSCSCFCFSVSFCLFWFCWFVFSLRFWSFLLL